MYITPADLLPFSLVIIGIIGLMFSAIKRSNRPSCGYFCDQREGLTV